MVGRSRSAAAREGLQIREMPCHHTLRGYRAEYMERGRLAESGRASLFHAIGERYDGINSWLTVRWRTKGPASPLKKEEEREHEKKHPM